MTVSIHAPTWGATLPFIDPFSTYSCFNPRAHVGRDTNEVSFFHSKTSFNPRAHVGRDVTFELITELETVSIHAPTWGATAY